MIRWVQQSWSAIDREQRRRMLRTGAVVLLALLLVWMMWLHYMVSPWTRDGRVAADVVNIAPEISDNIVEVRVAENQWVNRGDVLAVIDPSRYRIALDQAAAAVEARKQAWIESRQNQQRRAELIGRKAISLEEKQTADTTAAADEANYNQAVAERDLAALNLRRTTLVAPVNGYVTNLHLRVGHYAAEGQPVLSITDADSFRVIGYFEETKLPHIREGDRADVELMGVGPKVRGHVESVSAGILDPNNAGFAGFANVNPIFTWVRLAQRIPVRVHIDEVPKGVRLAAGQTCTVVIHPR